MMMMMTTIMMLITSPFLQSHLPHRWCSQQHSTKASENEIDASMHQHVKKGIFFKKFCRLSKTYLCTKSEDRAFKKYDGPVKIILSNEWGPSSQKICRLSKTYFCSKSENSVSISDPLTSRRQRLFLANKSLGWVKLTFARRVRTIFSKICWPNENYQTSWNYLCPKSENRVSISDPLTPSGQRLQTTSGCC